MATFTKGLYKLKNPEKYIGTHSPIWRSSWEHSVMQMCDNNPAIEKWASESVKIPYRNPLTGVQTVYVPDFFVYFTDKNNKKHVEIWEVKPVSHSVLESVGRSKYNQAQYVINMAKWQAARSYCRDRGFVFRIITENDIFYNPKRKPKGKK